MDDERGGAARGSPLAGWQVLVPGAAQWGLRVAELLAALEARTVLVPVVEVVPPEDLTPLDSALGALARGAYDWLVVTSPAAVLSLSARVATLANRGRQTPAQALGTFVGDTPVATLGPGCARALERSGVTATLVPTGRGAVTLLATFPSSPTTDDRHPGALGRPGRVLVARSQLADPGVADGLRALGWQVDDVIAYRTLTGDQPGARVRADALAGRLDAVLLGAPSTVDGLVELVGSPPATMVVGCVGPRTAQAAEAQGLPVHVVPEQTGAEGLVAALAVYAAAHPRG